MSAHSTQVGYLNLAPLPILYERATRPELGGRPFVVIGAIGNRGLVVAMSPEAFRAGIRPGITPDAARVLLSELVMVEERPTAYFQAACAVQDVCERFVPIVEAERQDAFSLDLTGTDRLYPDPQKLIRTLQGTVTREVLLPSRAGLGSSRLIARLASLQAHQQAILVISPGEEEQFLADYRGTVLPGVGVRIAERLKWLGVHTVRELAQVPVQTLEAAFGPRGIDLALAARGHDPRPRRASQSAKPIKREMTLEQLFYDPLAVRAALERLTAELGLELRLGGKQAREITLEIRYPDTPPTRARKRIPPTDLDVILQHIVREMCSGALTRRVRLRGMALSYGLLIPRNDQLRFPFATDTTFKRQRSLEEAMDRIRRRWGVKTIGPGTWWTAERRERPAALKTRTDSFTPMRNRPT